MYIVQAIEYFRHNLTINLVATNKSFNQLDVTLMPVY